MRLQVQPSQPAVLVSRAESPELRTAAFRLRYEVYVEECA